MLGLSHAETGAPRTLGLLTKSSDALRVASGYGLPFILVAYLGLKGGGYDEIIRGEVGVAAWWIVLLGALVGVLPVTRVTRAAWLGLGILAAFTLWTAAGFLWTDTAERSATELARVASLLGVLALVTLAQGAGSLRRTVWGVGVAIGLLGLLALVSRLQPGWLPGDTGGARNTDRLSYPLNYWNGLATLIAMGVPLLLVAAVQARRLIASATAVAIVPALVLASFYTLSRGGAAELAIGSLALFALFPRRLLLLPSIGIAGLGSLILVGAATQRDALETNLGNPDALAQGDEMLAMTLVVCAGAGLLQAALHLARTHGLGPRVRVAPSSARIALGLAVVVALVAGLAAGGPGELSDRWNEFKETPAPTATDAARFESTGGGGRYQFWSAAIEANQTDPMLGIGPGAFEFWEARTGASPAFVRDAHSLYLEVLAELGLVGLVMIVALIGLILAIGIARSRRALNDDQRGYAAAATATCLVFAVGASIDWAWELTVLPVVLLLMAAALFSPPAKSADGAAPRPLRSLWARAGIAAASLAALFAIVIPLAGASNLRGSQDSFEDGRFDAALDRAQTARALQPYAATPALQEALVWERQGQLDAAAGAARTATEDESTNWRTWLVLSRIEARRGNVDASIEAYRTARSLNPESPLFQ